MPLPWKDEYTLGIKIIDDQHKMFVAALNDLYKTIEDRSAKTEINKILKKIEEYAMFHFSTEETYFDEFNFEGAAEHKAKHLEFKNKFSDIQSQFGSDELALSFELMDFLENWLLSHVADMDTKYVKCFKDHGLK